MWILWLKWFPRKMISPLHLPSQSICYTILTLIQLFKIVMQRKKLNNTKQPKKKFLKHVKGSKNTVHGRNTKAKAIH